MNFAHVFTTLKSYCKNESNMKCEEDKDLIFSTLESRDTYKPTKIYIFRNYKELYVLFYVCAYFAHTKS